MKLALFQTEPQTDGVSAALRNLNDAARTAGGHAADILITPEMYLTGYAIGVDAVQAAALQPSGPSIQEVAEIAKRWGVGILIGYPERADDGNVYNTVELFDRKGDSRLRYRKTHLWGEIDRAQFSPGQSLSDVVEIEGWKIALAICYDVEFPELTRALTLKGAELILVPTASMKPYESVATQMVPTRAEENEICIAYSNYTGSERRIDYFGHSTVAGPDGKIIAQVKEGSELMIASLDRQAFHGWRAENDHRSDRRPELYSALTE
ncbi:UNVERIFIED_CONTAM: hypothetical protein GTU68_062265 [Idotea baltica]|nr:hypothetical protein [Idotea baltica]